MPANVNGDVMAAASLCSFLCAHRPRSLSAQRIMNAAALPQMSTPSPARLMSLDVFRGATIASMILVNNPGNWGAIYKPLDHAEWHGWTFTDLIFPFFIWIVGVAIPLSTARRLEPARRNPS